MSGKQLEILAYDKLKSTKGGFFFNFFSLSINADECPELFNQAGNAYILEKNISDAIKCYMCAYEEYDKLKGYEHYAIKNLSLVITYARQIDEFSSTKFISLLIILAQKYGKNGKMKEHNEKYLEISNIYEYDGNLNDALSILNNCVFVESLYYDDVIKRKAEILIKQNKYSDAGNAYDQLVGIMINRDNKSSFFSSRQYNTLSILCDLAANDLVGANNKYAKYISRDNMFETDYEGKLVMSSLKAIENQSICDFENACSEYDRVLKLKPLHVNLLTVAKKYIEHFNEDINTPNDNDYNEEDFC